MKPALCQAFDAEMKAALGLYEVGEFGKAFRHLETAHVLGQRHVLPHVLTHYWMLKIGLRRRAPAQVWGQVLRIVVGAVGSAVGVVPIGNTGGTNVGMFKRMPIDPALSKLMHETSDMHI